MKNCGEFRVREEVNGNLSVSPCWIWTDCPHQPSYSWEVWQYSTRGDCPQKIGAFQTRLEARQFELKQDSERFTDLRRVENASARKS